MNSIPENIVDVILKASDKKNDHFNLIYEFENHLENKSDKKLFLGDYSNKICRFCGKDKKETTFKKKAHVLPEFMGNKRFFSNFECDICNEHFSLYETSLSNYGGVFNTFARVKGKKGYYKHKGINEKTETFIENDSVIMLINDPTTNPPESFKSINIDSVNKDLRFSTNKYSYTPIHAFKTFIKIGLCLLKNDQLNNYVSTINWLLEKNELGLDENNPLFTVYQKIGRDVPKHPWAVLMKKRKIFATYPSPSHVLLVSYGLYSFQVFIPGNIGDKWLWQEKKINLPIEQHLVNHKDIEHNQIRIWLDNIDLSSKELLKNPKDEFSVGYK